MALTVPVAEIVENSKNPLLGKHESWGRVLLGDIATIQNGFPFKSSQFTRDEGMPLIRIRDVGAAGSDTYYVGDYDPAFIVKAGDLLIGMDGDFNCARWRGPDGLLNQRVCRVILKSDIYHPKLLDYALPGYLKAINDMTSSVTVKHLSSKSIAEIPLPLPPMEQQKYIVEEIEKQFSRLDDAVANLKRVKTNLKRYKAAVLKAAVEGKLTEAWRKQHLDAEPASALLQRILAERRAKWEQAELAKMQAKGKAPKDDTWKKKYPEPTTPDTTGLPELPEGWVWASLGQCFKVAVGATPSRKEQQYWNGNVSWVSSGEVQFCRIRETKEKISEVGLLNSSTQINPPGTVLLGMIGEGKTRGQAAILEIPAANNQNCAAIWVAHAGLPPSYVYHWFAAQYEETRLVGSGNNQQALNKSLVEAMVFPLPPLAEQQAIIEEIERRLSLTDEGESQVNTNLQRAERLRQSILSRAFSGKPHQVEMHTHG
ncbi:MAG: restriction endonuclease subunit S [Gammaproteobacteria bacterium]|nr:restriction endonuclease subunit S [Gammaproteobacteria bacterium]